MQLRLLLSSASGITVAFAVWAVLARAISTDPAAGLSSRLVLGLAALLPSVAVLDLIVLVQMRLRARSGAVDPLAGRDSHLLQVNQRVLTNTVEQLAGFAPALLSFTAGTSPAWMPSIIAAGFVFALARLAFWGGYMLNPLLRAPGMAATFAINIATLLGAVWAWWP